MKRLPKELDVQEIEKKWESQWEEMAVYRFDRADLKRPVFCVDTPPPYPSGEFHVGCVLNWTYFDILARYKRMTGFNVLFPQGWDCHGLPVEVEVEKENHILKTDLPPNDFRKLCEQLVNKNISEMKEAVIRLGYSIDWTTEYKTMDSDYWRRTQLSFLILYKNDYIYKGTHPVNWCPRCETAIADAEVEYDTRETGFFHVKFKLEKGGSIEVATTRPELIPACVAIAVNPEDPRYQKYIGSKVHVPRTERSVEVIADEVAEPEFGTGALMICTYGDKADVKTVFKHHLPVIMTIDEKGKMTEKAGRYVGLTISDAREAVLKDLKDEGVLGKKDQIVQEVSQCWRCHTAIEVLEREQWFMKTRILTDQVEKNALEITWYPDYMKHRLIDWAKSLEWDWVISRQRVFATPIPIWYCSKCHEPLIAEENWVPIDPRIEKPRTNKCPKCGSKEFTPETDVLDTWFDSSITCAVHAGWPDNKDWHRLFPADVHPSGVDIIRTWAYYLMVRHLALFNEKPYKSCLINGMVLGEDGREMHKSLGNYVASKDVLAKYGADAARQWAAAGGATGSDIPFRWPDVEYGWRFLIKLWNASSFVSKLLEDFTADETEEYELQLLDKWILSKYTGLTMRVTDSLDKCQFNLATEELRNFTWHIFCDSYLEAAKDRLYNPNVYGEQKRRAAQYTLFAVLRGILKLLAPIIPHLTEEIYQTLYATEEKAQSIHLSNWPLINEKLCDEESERQGDLLIAVIAEVRREKAEKHLPLNAKISKLTLYSPEEATARVITEARGDITGTLKVADIQVLNEKGRGRQVKPYEIRFVTEY
jgi:valyl-tRNA synthetase